jgi:DNA-binding CsgD family transcriptional regulator
MNWNDILRDYIFKHSDAIRKTTRPIRERFGVEYFTYHRIDRDGKYTVLVDRPDWADHYVTNKLYLNDPYLRHPDVFFPGVCLMDHHGSEEYRERIVKEAKEATGLDLCAMMIQKDEKGVEFFGFAGRKGSCALEKVYLNQSYLLESFGEYFKKQLNPILFQMESEAGFLVNLKGEHFFSDEPLYPEIPNPECLAFLEDIDVKEARAFSRLSPREKQCLQLLLEGRSSKETAAILNLSPRTVETYFENLKKKFSCWNKQELFALARGFANYRLLP